MPATDLSSLLDRACRHNGMDAPLPLLIDTIRALADLAARVDALRPPPAPTPRDAEIADLFAVIADYDRALCEARQQRDASNKRAEQAEARAAKAEQERDEARRKYEALWKATGGDDDREGAKRERLAKIERDAALAEVEELRARLRASSAKVEAAPVAAPQPAAKGERYRHRLRYTNADTESIDIPPAPVEPPTSPTPPPPGEVPRCDDCGRLTCDCDRRDLADGSTVPPGEVPVPAFPALRWEPGETGNGHDHKVDDACTLAAFTGDDGSWNVTFYGKSDDEPTARAIVEELHRRVGAGVDPAALAEAYENECAATMKAGPGSSFTNLIPWSAFTARDRAGTIEAMRRALATVAPALTVEPVAWRPEVRAFADMMEAQLRRNDHKPGWKGDRLHALFDRLREESGELLDAIRGNGGDIGKEAADVANFAMMIADVAGALTVTTAPGGEVAK